VAKGSQICASQSTKARTRGDTRFCAGYTAESRNGGGGHFGSTGTRRPDARYGAAASSVG